jgi:predicted metal-binding protein
MRRFAVGDACESVSATRRESTRSTRARYINTVIRQNFFVAKFCDSESENRARHDASQCRARVIDNYSSDRAMKETPAIKG